MKEYTPAPQLQQYIHRYWIVSSMEAMPAEKCVLDGFVKLFIYLNDNLAEYYDQQGREKECGAISGILKAAPAIRQRLQV